VFIQAIKGSCSRPDDLKQALDRWEADLSAGAQGWLGTTAGVTDDGTFVGVVRFESAEAARANSERPEQGEWWATAEKAFDGSVEFHDCPDVTVLLDGGSDEAGFVQVIEGDVLDRKALEALDEDTSRLREMRPEIIGGTMAVDEGGHFVQTMAFTDEEAARKGEAEAAMPEDVAEKMAAALRPSAFHDLRGPWFSSPR
jgi:hypothetical protein